MADTNDTKPKKKVVVVKKKPTTEKSYSEEDRKKLMDFARNHGDAIQTAVRQEQRKDTDAARDVTKVPLHKSDFKAANHDSSMGANVFTGVSRADKDIIQSELARAIREGNGPQQYDPETSLTGRRQVENDLSYFQDVGDTDAAGWWKDFEDVWNKGIKGERLPTTKERDTMLKDFETPVAKTVYSGVVNLELHKKKEALENRKKNLEEELDENPEKTELKDEIADVEKQLQEVRSQLPAVELSAGTSRKQQFDSQLKAYKDRLNELAGEIYKNPHSERLLNERENIRANIKALESQRDIYAPRKGQDSLITNYGQNTGKWSMTVRDLKTFMEDKGLTPQQVGEVIAQRFPTPPSDDMSITSQDVWECAHLVPQLAQETFKKNNAQQLEVNKKLEEQFHSPRQAMFNYLGMHPELIEGAVPAYMAVKNIKVPGDAFAQLKKEIVTAAKEAFGAGKGRADEFHKTKSNLISQQSLEKGTIQERVDKALGPLFDPFIKEFLVNYNDPSTNAGVTPLVQGATVETEVASDGGEGDGEEGSGELSAPLLKNSDASFVNATQDAADEKKKESYTSSDGVMNVEHLPGGMPQTQTPLTRAEAQANLLQQKIDTLTSAVEELDKQAGIASDHGKKNEAKELWGQVGKYEEILKDLTALKEKLMKEHEAELYKREHPDQPAPYEGESLTEQEKKFLNGFLADSAPIRSVSISGPEEKGSEKVGKIPEVTAGLSGFQKEGQDAILRTLQGASSQSGTPLGDVVSGYADGNTEEGFTDNNTYEGVDEAIKRQQAKNLLSSVLRGINSQTGMTSD